MTLFLQYLPSPLIRLSAVLLMIFGLTACNTPNSQPTPSSNAEKTATPVKVIAYYMGDGTDLARYDINQLTHIIYSFLHLQGNQLAFDNQQDEEVFARVVALKKTYPHLKVLLSLGGWGGCETCSAVFSTPENRHAFAASTLAILQRHQADGIDLDWEYPTVPGYPGHPYSDADRDNFSALVASLRAQLGTDYELSFAAGGFDLFLKKAVDWDTIMPLLDNVNIMSYDIVNGGTPHTGHHTALFSTPQQKDSTDNAVQFLLRKGVAPEKIVIGAAFYARVWDEVEPTNQGLYQPGVHVPGYGYKDLANHTREAEGFQYHWDAVAQAPTYYSAQHKRFMTLDDPRSLAAKVDYVKQYSLGGIMFWQLPNDSDSGELLNAIHTRVKHHGLRP